jgi:hypothetical protein
MFLLIWFTASVIYYNSALAVIYQDFIILALGVCCLLLSARAHIKKRKVKG